MIYLTLTIKEAAIGRTIIHSVYRVHKELGPGLLEKVYEVCFCHLLVSDGCTVSPQLDVQIVFHPLTFQEGLMLDVRVNNLVICELKAFER